MTEFWEASFIEKQMMWGLEPSNSAILAKNFFLEKKVKDILIPGFGYGRNAKIFSDNGIQVTGIEISKTAIDLARNNGVTANIYHGSVTNMPFDNKRYDGIFCYALIHLLNSHERKKLMKDCYNQLKPEGYMIFTAVTKKAPMYGKGRELSQDRFEIMDGVKMFFYDSNSIKREFGKYGLIEFSEIDEPNKVMENKPAMNFVMIKCKKGAR
ncbi:class I SAM-dependent methyltransferase [Paenibacillus alvei]|uniref:Class I SAM-dependent methyltransferase n=1 Tax=Paenibacillus alvei TaxID=44250 RepID=A0AAP7A2M2_PAEAL|nr:class I SAM-dependent methyltransferase [Paenibacillus alvei]MCY9544286.1 class I SAM-dependent methyltransferase [Paenibacillus alvei]MCY9706134.1 class I SAM-dependent methyltransferase [Paenibacillus alvei]MCY9735266.1 class I SAM-dependent methyltransferase [Paenibacillus alvei]MCY9755837.1 class I SAM-dependent methyltransferase [Paenibacillus alvei]MCY9762269.1 class I SAM-dependent methyltransferase [Paenibacillus alvei]